MSDGWESIKAFGTVIRLRENPAGRLEFENELDPELEKIASTLTGVSTPGLVEFAQAARKQIASGTSFATLMEQLRELQPFHLDKLTAHKVARLTSPAYLAAAAKSTREGIRTAVVGNLNTPLATLRSLYPEFPLAWNMHWEVVRQLDRLEESDFEHLLKGAHQQLTIGILSRTRNLALLEKACAEKSWINDVGLARNPITPMRLLRAIIEREHPYLPDDNALSAIAQRTDLDPELFQLLRGKRKDIVQAMVENPALPLELVEAMATSSDLSERLAITSCPKLPAHLAERLSQDRSLKVREAVAKRPAGNARFQLKERLSKEPGFALGIVTAAMNGTLDQMTEVAPADAVALAKESLDSYLEQAARKVGAHL